jgi:hypothetical protein
VRASTNEGGYTRPRRERDHHNCHAIHNCHVTPSPPPPSVYGDTVTTTATSRARSPQLPCHLTTATTTPQYHLAQPRNQTNGQFAAPARVEGGVSERREAGEDGSDAGSYPLLQNNLPPPPTSKYARCTSIDVRVAFARLQGVGEDV